MLKSPSLTLSTKITSIASNIKLDTVTVCFDLDAKLANRFRQHSKDEKQSQDQLLNSILSNYFNELDSPNEKNPEREFRKHIRKDISMPGVIEIKLSANETQYKPVNIINISLGGIGIKLDSNASRVMDNINKLKPFVVIFNIPNISDLIQIVCKPVHITMSATAEIGAAFLRLPESLRKALRQQFQL